jgi:hypothetical protein
MEIKKGDFVWLNDKKEKVKFIEKQEGYWSVHFGKPNLFQRLMYWLGLWKDLRYNGKKVDWMHDDEAGQM